MKAVSGADTSVDTSCGSGLPRAVQHHLARQLRARYVEDETRPAYAGDPALPSPFYDLVFLLAATERSRERQRASECRLAAVSAALHLDERSPRESA